MRGMKKGVEAATNAMILIVILAGLIAAFMIFIPPEDVAVLLNETVEEEKPKVPAVTLPPGEPRVRERGVILSDDFGGKALLLGRKEETERIDLGDVSLKVGAEPRRYFLKESVKVSKGWFSKEGPVLDFVFSDWDKTDRAFLIFGLSGGGGKELRIEVNEKIVAVEDLGGVMLPKTYEIEIAKSNLGEGENSLKFSVDGGEYYVGKIEIRQIFRTGLAEGEVMFEIEDLSYVREARVEFSARCSDVGEESMLKLRLNDVLVYNKPLIGVVDIEADVLDGLVERGNSLKFILEEKGECVLTGMVLRLKREPEVYSGSFDIGKETSEELEREEKKIYVRLFFEDGGLKEAGVRVNKREFMMSTEDLLWEKDVGIAVVEDGKAKEVNTISITGKGDFFKLKKVEVVVY